MLSLAATRALIPAEARKSTLDRSTMMPDGALASAESIACAKDGAVSMSTQPLTDTTARRSTHVSSTLISLWPGRGAAVTLWWLAMVSPRVPARAYGACESAKGSVRAVGLNPRERRRVDAMPASRIRLLQKCMQRHWP